MMMLSILLMSLFAAAAPSQPTANSDPAKPAVVRYAPVPFPEAARRARLAGTVTVEVVIDSEGSVTKASLVKGLPLKVSEKCVAAAQSWRFDRSESLERHVTLEFVFQLDSPKEPADGFRFEPPYRMVSWAQSPLLDSKPIAFRGDRQLPRSVAQPVVPADAPKAARR